jgi:DNA-binding SARP family transcriptional activator/tetratricopeptide (TPR) repeat protein
VLEGLRSDPRDVQESTLFVRLLGGVELRLGTERLAPLESARAESLLAYLLLHRDAPQTRQRLAFRMWPDSSESQALTNLRQVLFNLRRALPCVDRFIEVGRRTLQWRSDAPWWLDVAAFEQAMARGRLEEAVELYGGDLLEGSYDDWVLEERERLQQLYGDALERLAVWMEEAGRWAEAVRYGERLLRQDPLREETYRLLMRVHRAAGDAGRALRVYHECAVTLRRELGIEPSSATRAAYEGLLSSEARVEEPAAGPPLVGRSRERAALSACWRAAASGEARLVLVSGEPGIGKSRLVEELRSWCSHHGAATAEARAYAAEGAMAFGLVAAWLRSEPIAARLRRLPRADLTELARLLPELLSQSEVAAPEPLEEAEQRQRLFGAAARAILCAGRPILLIADDLQWCDEQTLRFVHYLLRAEAHAPLLVAATARREDIDARHPAAELIAGLQALERFSEIALERLTREETAMLAQRITGRAPAETDVRRLYEDSEGNPLFIVEALRAGATEPNAKVQGVIAARLAQLSEIAGELAGIAATIGREFTAPLLSRVSGVDDEVFVRGLDELWRRGLVRERGPNAYDFSHGRIREAAYAALSPAQRRHHHLRVAEALEPEASDAVSAQVAAHYDAAGEPAKAVEWHVMAAAAAQRLHASADALRSLERALELVAELPATPEQAALELQVLTAFPAPLVAVGGYLSERMAWVHERALALAAELGVEPEPPLLRSLALATLTRGEYEAAHAVGERLRARAVRDADDVLWVESAYVLGVAAFWRGLLEDARRHFTAAVERYRPQQRTAHLLRYGQDPQMFCLMRLAYTLWLLGRGDEADRAVEEVLSLAERSSHPYSRMATLLWAACLALDQHEPRLVRERTRAALKRPSVEWQVEWATDTLGGYLAVLDGRPQEDVERARRAFADLSPRPTAPGVPGILARILLETCAAAGDAQAGLVAADEALEIGGGTALWQAEIRRLRAGFLECVGAERADVRGELEQAIAVAERQGARPFERRAREDLERLSARTR